MAGMALNQIENQFAHLPPAEQLVLLERLVEQFRVGGVVNSGVRSSRSESSVTAAQLQGELDRLKEQFKAAQSDKLGEAW